MLTDCRPGWGLCCGAETSCFQSLLFGATCCMPAVQDWTLLQSARALGHVMVTQRLLELCPDLAAVKRRAWIALQQTVRDKRGNDLQEHALCPSVCTEVSIGLRLGNHMKP